MRVAFLFSALTVGTDGHGYMANPISRGILHSTTPHGIGAFAPVTADNPGDYINTCGQTHNSRNNDIVGGVSQNTNQYQPNRDCISTLKIGSIFRVHVRILAHHLGVQEVRLCSNRRLSSNTEDIDDCLLLDRATAEEAGVDCKNHNYFGPDDVCLDKDLSNPSKWYMSPCCDGGARGAGAMGTWCDKFMYFKIPTTVAETDEATLQWYWKTGNSCTPGPNARGTCDYVQQDQFQPEWCAGQWPCDNCKTHSGTDAKMYDFSKPSVIQPYGGERRACSEVFTTCADVKLSANEGNTTGPSGPKDAFLGSSLDVPAVRSCTDTLLDVVYSDTAEAYTQGGAGSCEPSGGGGGSSGGGGTTKCANGANCYVAVWADPCHQWARTKPDCIGVGGEWLPDLVTGPQPQPEPETTVAPMPKPPAPTPALTKPPTPALTKAPTPGATAVCAVPGNSQSATDDHCAPCGKGQTYWPCNIEGLCQDCPPSLLQKHEKTKFTDPIVKSVKKHATIDADGGVDIDSD